MCPPRSRSRSPAAAARAPARASSSWTRRSSPKSLGPRYSWGIIQHEYAHQIDYVLFQERDRAAVRRTLGGQDWCYETAGLDHDEHGCERFADVFSWAFWPTKRNVLRADAKAIASGMTPKQLRAFVNRLLAA